MWVPLRFLLRMDISCSTTVLSTNWVLSVFIMRPTLYNCASVTLTSSCSSIAHPFTKTAPFAYCMLCTVISLIFLFDLSLCSLNTPPSTLYFNCTPRFLSRVSESWFASRLTASRNTSKSTGASAQPCWIQIVTWNAWLRPGLQQGPPFSFHYAELHGCRWILGGGGTKSG